DALLALGAQAIGEQRQVDALVAAAARDILDVLQLVLERRLGVVEQPPDQGRLAVVDRARGREPQQLGFLVEPDRAGSGCALARRHQKYPSRLRSSIAASVNLSSARVAPRSVTRAAATSAITSSSVLAVDFTAPVHVMSPIVRKRTTSLTIFSPGRSFTNGFAA